MSNRFKEMPKNWRILVGAATRAMEEKGFELSRIPGRGRSNIWDIRKDGDKKRASIRTTKDKWFAFPPLEGGKKWATLDDVDVVVVSAVDAKTRSE